MPVQSEDLYVIIAVEFFSLLDVSPEILPDD